MKKCNISHYGDDDQVMYKILLDNVLIIAHGVHPDTCDTPLNVRGAPKHIHNLVAYIVRSLYTTNKEAL